jgi:hypothetical protein
MLLSIQIKNEIIGIFFILTKTAAYTIITLIFFIKTVNNIHPESIGYL